MISGLVYTKLVGLSTLSWGILCDSWRYRRLLDLIIIDLSTLSWGILCDSRISYLPQVYREVGSFNPLLRNSLWFADFGFPTRIHHLRNILSTLSWGILCDSGPVEPRRKNISGDKNLSTLSWGILCDSSYRYIVSKWIYLVWWLFQPSLEEFFVIPFSIRFWMYSRTLTLKNFQPSLEEFFVIHVVSLHPFLLLVGKYPFNPLLRNSLWFRRGGLVSTRSNIFSFNPLLRNSLWFPRIWSWATVPREHTFNPLLRNSLWFFFFSFSGVSTSSYFQPSLEEFFVIHIKQYWSRSESCS